MRFCPAFLPPSGSTLNRVARLIRTHRKTIGSRRRALDHGTQTLLAPAYLRKAEALRDLAARFGISAATAWRRTRVTIDLFAARAPASAPPCSTRSAQMGLRNPRRPPGPHRPQPDRAVLVRNDFDRRAR
ncbi:transposase family protein [Glycomyces xiaoerkulensis]|uniref:transposase family protein n=1 Tax=Glycomyces xiaoerkulensis TaxID=2038139 RepID=UPI000C265968